MLPAMDCRDPGNELYGCCLMSAKPLSILCSVIPLLFSIFCSNSPEGERAEDKLPHFSEHDGAGIALLEGEAGIPASASASFRFEFTVGEGGIATGGGIVVQFPMFWWWSLPQMENPRLPGYTSCGILRGGAELDAWCTDLGYLQITLREGILEPDDRLLIIYGDTGDGEYENARVRVQPFREACQQIVFKVDADGDGDDEEVADHPCIEVYSRKAVRLHVVSPSIVPVQTPFAVHVSALDFSDNLCDSFSGTVSLRLGEDGDTELGTRIYTTALGGTHRFEVELAVEGIFRFVAEDSVYGLAGRSNPVLARDSDAPLQLYWGDIHGHSGWTDGIGSFEDYYHYAREVSRLDIASLTDHDHHGLHLLDPPAWTRLMDVTDRYYEPGAFVTIYGYEWTNWDYGHRNVYLLERVDRVLDSTDPSSDTPEELWRHLDPKTAITVPHHPAGLPVPINWDHHNAEFEPVVEIASVHGSSEYFGCPFGIRGAQPGHSVQDALHRGYRLGLIGSGDSHTGHPGKKLAPFFFGLMGVWSEGLTREDVWRAIRLRRVYGTSGARIIVDFRINRAIMGSVLNLTYFDASRQLSFTIIGEDEIRLVEIVRNNRVWASFEGRSILVTESITDSEPAQEGDFYYLRVTQADEEMVWTSPIWITCDEQP